MIGIDEVGRGAWAGPLLVAAVRLTKPIEGLTDSKLLTAVKREKLCVEIQQSAQIGLGWLSAEELDKIGLSEALKLCAHQAAAYLNPLIDEEIVIDGSVNFLPDHSASRTEPKAEIKYPAVAAASIVAKVWRDRFMQQLSLKSPEYGFDKHVGYGTALHLAQLHTHGTSFWHRHSFKPVRIIAQNEPL